MNRYREEQFRQIAEDITTQDNRATSHPIFVVQEKRHSSWHMVQPFFTDRAAEKFIEMNGYNYDRLRVYVASGYRNDEWQAARALFLRHGGASDVVMSFGVVDEAGLYKKASEPDPMKTMYVEGTFVTNGEDDG